MIGVTTGELIAALVLVALIGWAVITAGIELVQWVLAHLAWVP